MKARKIPLRRCVGCMVSKPKRELIRIVADDEGKLSIDTTGKAQGRGVYLCPSTDCFNMARKKKSISRSLKITISEEKLDKLFKELLSHEEKN